MKKTVSSLGIKLLCGFLGLLFFLLAVFCTLTGIYMGGMGYFAVIAALSFNAILESLASTIVCVAVYLGLFISSNKKSKLSQEED
jgi:hypothetical protein